MAKGWYIVDVSYAYGTIRSGGKVQNMESIIQIGIPLVGVITAIISAALSYYYAKKKQLDADERRLKEKYYLSFIQAVSNIVVSDDLGKARDNLADAQNQLLLVGSADVVSNLMKFHDYIKPSGQKKHGFDSKEHDKLLTELIKTMRTDLYKDKNINNRYPIIHLTGKN